jgi:adenosyl cobinamide kinase/adenosyl cobinamide phosphate guanylyltransferase
MGPEEDPQILKGVAWFDSLFPYQKPIFDPRTYFINQHVESIKQDFSEYIPKSFPGDAIFTITRVEENLKEGGCYVEFRYKGGTIEEAVETIQKHLRVNNKRGWLGLERVNVYQVKGTPWVEDLVSRVPSSRLHVEFHGPDLTVESLFREFRVFGRIVDIALQPSSSKEIPRFASVRFLNQRSATSARNCIHGELFGETRLAIGYEKRSSYWQQAWHWITNNLRLSVPIILAILAGITFAVFDPWRVFSITNQITGRYNLSSYTKTATKWWNLFTSLVQENLGIEHPSPEKKSVSSQQWSEREAQEARLAANLKQPPESLTLVFGPKGSGKTAFVNEVLANQRNKLYIKCDELVGKGDYQLLSHLSSQVNFFPTFGFLAQVGGFIDAMITATTGAKANISTTNEGEIQKILECLTLALENVTENQKKKYQKHFEQMKDEDFVLEEIEYPVVVIDDFLSKENVREHFIYTKLAEWASQIAEYRIAHVVFVSDNPSSTQVLGKVQTKSLELYTLSDATPEGALSYVRRRLGYEFKVDSIKTWLEGLGGRLHDLELFISKIQTGSDPKTAYEEMIHRAVSELRKMGCLDDPTQKLAWTSIQFWKIVQLLSKQEKVY